MLLDVVVAGEPGEVEPVAHLPLHVGPALLAGAVPERAGVVVALQGDDVADGAVVDAARTSRACRCGSASRSRRRARAGCAAASSAAARTRRTPGPSTAIGFSQKMCLPARTAASRCSGRKPGGVHRSTTSDGVDDAAGRRRSRRSGVRRARRSWPRISASLLSWLRLAVDAVVEGVAHGDEPDVRVGAQGLGGGAGAAAAAADEADPQHVVAAGMDRLGQGQGRGRGGGGLQEAASIDWFARMGRHDESPGDGVGGIGLVYRERCGFTNGKRRVRLLLVSQPTP